MSARCSDKRAGPTAELTGPKIRKSRAGLPRALVLIAVHVLVAIHIVHWASTGKTLSPLEPSESMEFSKHGVVNAGLVFFALSIASTLLLGRWFCGWACHVVALQDGARWLLLKMGIRPRMVNLGLLGAVPWLAFTYMFLAPLVQRAIHGQDLAAQTVQWTTQSFWSTFPSWPVALATFLVCGFAIVYFLGSKGFCNYGCPYGGIFGVVDQLAPVRIRVTDACEGCGHCTAVCTSNVKVHQEVRDFGAVVDPACMKCLDCVSVCPNDALYVGFGAPAIVTKPRRPLDGATRGRWLSLAVLLGFIVATLCVFMAYDGGIDGRLLAVLSAGAFAVALLFRGKAKRAEDYALPEQLLLGALFLVAMLVFRGYRNAVPFLFALGLSSTLAYLAVQWMRLFYERDVSLQRHRFRIGGKLTTSGVAFAALMLPVGWLWVHAGIEQSAARVEAEAARGRSQRARQVFLRGLEAGTANRFAEAIDRFHQALELDPSLVEARVNLGGMLCASGRYAEGIAELERALAERPADVDTHVLLARAYLATDDAARARTTLEGALKLAPDHEGAHALFAELCEKGGDPDCASRHRTELERIQRLGRP
jgi:tetratricopeptide (TPR) repeat protein/NAD-dependent dihydropyrimidine dehydrogenase PreA subunit